MSFESGVKYYTHAHTLIEVSFPEDKCVCQWCPFVKNEDSLKRHKCVITGEFLVYPFTGVGQECPLIIEERQVATAAELRRTAQGGFIPTEAIK